LAGTEGKKPFPLTNGAAHGAVTKIPNLLLIFHVQNLRRHPKQRRQHFFPPFRIYGHPASMLQKVDNGRQDATKQNNKIMGHQQHPAIGVP
jgi:hypothetical protein